MEGKGLFSIVKEGYDVKEADAYISFLLSEYNKVMERVAVLEHSSGQDQTSKIFGTERDKNEDAKIEKLSEALKDMTTQKNQAEAEKQELNGKLAKLRKKLSALEEKQSVAAPGTNPTVEHTAKIIAEILIQARDGGEKIIAQASTEAEKIMSGAKEKARGFEAEAKEKALRAKEVFEESQKRIQEAYSFLQNCPNEFSV